MQLVRARLVDPGFGYRYVPGVAVRSQLSANAAGDACQRHLSSQTYLRCLLETQLQPGTFCQPAGRYWDLPWRESALLLVAAMALLGGTVLVSPALARLVLCPRAPGRKHDIPAVLSLLDAVDDGDERPDNKISGLDRHWRYRYLPAGRLKGTVRHGMHLSTQRPLFLDRLYRPEGDARGARKRVRLGSGTGDCF